MKNEKKNVLNFVAIAEIVETMKFRLVAVKIVALFCSVHSRAVIKSPSLIREIN